MKPPVLVVFSHLRWTWVWQRPQQLISRLTGDHDVVFVEEPMVCDVDRPEVRVERVDGVVRLWVDVPPGSAPCFGTDVDRCYEQALASLASPSCRVWLYTPMALDLASALHPSGLVYDVMDDLTSFRDAHSELPRRHLQALARADVVFTGGRSLQRAVQALGVNAHQFSSGVEPEHYAPAIAMRRSANRTRPVVGYLGVIDERVDLELIAGVADALPDWQVEMVGPVTKIDPATLPQAENLCYLGQRTYDQLPAVLAGFDVAMMPFALNEATRSISPTKTLEYFAAGLPVVSTRVADVVADHREGIAFADDAASFALACRSAYLEDPDELLARLTDVVHANHWDVIIGQMVQIWDAAALATGEPS